METESKVRFPSKKKTPKGRNSGSKNDLLNEQRFFGISDISGVFSVEKFRGKWKPVELFSA